MHRTDYSKIAEVYDEAPDRGAKPDARLDERIRAAEGRRLHVLDVACGTGEWLATQVASFEEAGAWFGIDRSPEMLAHAQKKMPEAELVVGKAEELPYESDIFDFLTTTFAFHHFEDKDRALDQMVRVLSKNGTFRMTNICPEHMRDWWVYRYFPEAIDLDEERFWSASQIFDALAARGLSPVVRVRVRYYRSDPTYLHERAALRDISQIANLDEEQIARGLSRLSAAAAEGSPVTDQLALLECVAEPGEVPGVVGEISLD